MDNPLVSICCISYNHEAYIRDCLEGFLMQQTDFPFEVLIHDDASSDHTADIIREYEAKYPDIIKPICEQENQYAKGVGFVELFGFARAKGKYIAICEGDDFWIDPHKLQRQFDFMESQPDHSLCGCRHYVFNEINKTFAKGADYNFNSDDLNNRHDIDCLIARTPFHTSSFFIRTDNLHSVFYQLKQDSIGCSFGDTLLCFHLATTGKLKLIDRYMTAYRIHYGSAMSFGSGREIKHMKFFADQVRILTRNHREDLIPVVIKRNIPQLFAPRLGAWARLKKWLFVLCLPFLKSRRDYKKIMLLSPQERVRCHFKNNGNI